MKPQFWHCVNYPDSTLGFSKDLSPNNLKIKTLTFRLVAKFRWSKIVLLDNSGLSLSVKMNMENCN